jgi:hypothetical protein
VLGQAHGSLAAEPARERVAIVAVDLAEAFEPDRGAIEEALVRGLEAAGLDVVSPEQSRRRLEGHPDLMSCTSEECRRALAVTVGTDWLVQAEVTVSRRRYDVAIALIDASDGRKLADESIRCRASDPCPTVANNVGEVARELGRLGLKELQAAPHRAPPADAPPVLAGSTASVPPLPAAAVVAVAPPRAVAAARRPLLPWLTIGGGGALLATSAVLFAIDGRGVDCAPPPGDPGAHPVCLRVRDTRSTGLIVGAVGLAAAAGGVAWLLLDRRADTSVAIGPAGLLLQRRF